MGKVRSCSQDGLRVSVDFFDDIFIPAGNIQQPNKFTMDTMGKPKWIWYYGDEDDGEMDEMVIEPGAKIRFRVKVNFRTLLKATFKVKFRTKYLKMRNR